VDQSAVRLRRLHLRSWRRGTREMDLILGRFADVELPALIADELDSYESLLEENDQDLYRWVSGSVAVPRRHTSIVGRIRAHHRL
jgi:antitoxin CptB